MQIFSRQFVYATQGLWYFVRSWSREIQVNPRNSQKHAKCLEILYKSYQIDVCTTYLKLISAKLSWNFVTETCEQCPETPRRNYVAKNWALAMILKALELVYFWSVLLLKEQMMTSVRKTLKMLVWSAQNRSISSEFSMKITTKWAVFYRLLFGEVCPENSRKIDLSEALNSMARSIRFETIMDGSWYKFGGKLALFMRFGTFSMMKAKQDNMKCLF